MRKPGEESAHSPSRWRSGQTAQESPHPGAVSAHAGLAIPALSAVAPYCRLIGMHAHKGRQLSDAGARPRTGSDRRMT